VPKTPTLKVGRKRVSQSTDQASPASRNSEPALAKEPNHQHLEDRLRQLLDNSPEIAASIIVSLDGLTLASVLPEKVKEQRVSAMAASMLSLGERTTSELGRGNLDQVYIKGKIGHVILMSIGGKAVLTAIARDNAKIGLLMLDLQRAARDIENLV
jgi:uncharacterized protein